MAGDITRAAAIARSLQPLRELHAKWIMGYWHRGRMPLSEMKAWQEIIGMHGGPVRPPVLAITEAARAELAADLARTGIVERARAGLRDAAE